MKINKTGVVRLSEEYVQHLLNNLKDVENRRYDYSQFSKLFNSDVIWYGYIEGGELKALAALIYNRLGCNEYYINEIQSFKKGFGKKLLVDLFYHLSKIYLLVNPDADRNLLGYYKQFHLKEVEVYSDIWNEDLHILYKGDDELKKRIIDYYK